MIIAVSALIGFAIGLVAGYMLATLGTTNQKAGVLSDKKDCGVETEGISQSVKVLAPFLSGDIIVDELFQFYSSGDW